MIYRFSINATICFDVIATTKEYAEAEARRYVADKQPEAFEICDDRHTVCYPVNEESLTLESTWTEDMELVTPEGGD